MGMLKLMPLAGAVLALAATSVQAATFTVNKVADTNDGVCDADCSLREAVAAADASADNDTVVFDAAVFGTAQTITLAGTDILVVGNGSLLIDGPGADLLTISGNNLSRILSISTGAVATVEGLRLTQGNGVSSLTTGRGGAVYNNGGTLTLDSVVITGNSAANGGGLNTATAGTTVIDSSVISDNTASGSGGGLQNFSTSFLTVIDSTFSGNVSNGTTGGGAGQVNGTARFINSTLSGNSAPAGSGGGLQSNGTLFELINTTITANSSLNNGGGLHRATANVNGFLRNTIIAGNSGAVASPDVSTSATISSLGNNLVGVVGTSAGWIASDLLNQDALLGPLGDNGGPTFTHSIAEASPAIDAGDDCVLDSSCASNNAPFNLTADQRGEPRPSGAGVDIGAYERIAGPALPIFDNGGLATGATTNSGVAAPVGTQWSEVQNETGVTTFSNTLAGVSGSVTATVFRIADDFTVPPGETWTVDAVVFYAYQTGFAGAVSPINAYTLRIWDGVPDAPGSSVLCGDTTTDQLVASDDSGLWRVFNTQVPAPGTVPATNRRIWASTLDIPGSCAAPGAFPEGTYWLDWNSRIGTTTAHFAPTVTVPGARNRPGDNARQFNGTAWVDVLDVGNPDLIAPDVTQDFPFQLYGSIESTDIIFADGFELP
jgi:CSLREA domain-containing protein